MPYYNLYYHLSQCVAGFFCFFFFYFWVHWFETGSQVCGPGWLGTLKDPLASSPSSVIKGICYYIWLGIILHSCIQLAGILCWRDHFSQLNNVGILVKVSWLAGRGGAYLYCCAQAAAKGFEVPGQLELHSEVSPTLPSPKMSVVLQVCVCAV